MAIEKIKIHKSSGVDRIPAELIEAVFRTFRSEIQQLINSIWKKEELPVKWSRSLYLVTRRVMKQIVIITGAYHFCQLHTKFYPEQG